MKNILLINDMPSYGRVALAAMAPILTKYGHSLYQLPTALISNPFSYEKVEILDTTSYLEKTLENWKKLGFQYDVIAIGYLFSKEQVEIIREYLEEQESFVFFDPIMGDHGKLYHSVTEEQVETMKEMVAYADVIIPNLTEGSFLTGEKEYRRIAEKLREMGAKNVILTSCEEKNQYFNYIVTDEGEEKIYYEKFSKGFGGSGDMFSALLIGEWCKDQRLNSGVKIGTEKMNLLMEKTLEEGENYDIIPIEKYIQWI